MKEVKQFKSDSGVTFDNACDALKDDVRHWLIDAAGNDPIAKQVAQRISDDIETFAPMIAQLYECCPRREPELFSISPDIIMRNASFIKHDILESAQRSMPGKSAT